MNAVPTTKTVFTVRCPEGHALARVDDFDGVRVLMVRAQVGELGANHSALTGDRTNWAPLGRLDDEAADGTNFPATCECGSTVLNAASIRADYKATAGQRERKAVADVATPGLYATLPPQSHLGVAPPG